MATRKREPKAKVKGDDARETEAKKTCFVMMPFSEPINSYYASIYVPAILDAGLTPVRADDLFRPSPIVSDLWQMIQESDVLFGELTTKNANVFYELGLAHAIGKPVVMVSRTLDDVPFDLQQLRVLTYDNDDPEWGKKLAHSVTRSLTETLASPRNSVPTAFRRIVASHAPEQSETGARLSNLESRVVHLERNMHYPQDSRYTLTDAAADLADRLAGKARLSSWAYGNWYDLWKHRGLSLSGLALTYSDRTGEPPPKY